MRNPTHDRLFIKASATFATGLVFLMSSVLVIVADRAQAQVVAHQKISDTNGGFPPGLLSDADNFGTSTAFLGDLEASGQVGNPAPTPHAIAVGAFRDNDGSGGGIDRGAVWILFLNADGTVNNDGMVSTARKISETSGNGFTGPLEDNDRFGTSVAWLGDLGAGAPTPYALAVGTPGTGSVGSPGGVWILFLNSDGTVGGSNLIAQGQQNLLDLQFFGFSVASLEDLDGDGFGDLAVGERDDDAIGGGGQGAVWILFLKADGTLSDTRSPVKIFNDGNSLPCTLDDCDFFGASLSYLDQLDPNDPNSRVLAVGATGDDDGAPDAGAVYLLSLDTVGSVGSCSKINDTDVSDLLESMDQFGSSLDGKADLNGDGVPDLCVGAVGDGDGGTKRGAVWVLYLNPDGSVLGRYRISDLHGGFSGQLDDQDGLANVSTIGDLDGDGITDLAVGASADDDGGLNMSADHGAVWIMFLSSAGLGAVNSGSGAITSVLSVNGGTGVVSVATGADITVSLSAAPLGPLANASYALWAWRSPPVNPFEIAFGENSLGCTSNPTPFQPFEDPKAFRCLNGGFPAILCSGLVELGAAPSKAPWSLTKSGGLPNPSVFTLQAIIEDNGADNIYGVSLTNTVVLRVQ